MNVIHKIDETVKKYNMLKSGDTIVVGVSGGKDSMLLLYYLLQKRSELSLNLIVANVEHGIRGESSERDSEFVKQFCSENGVDFKILRIKAVEESKAAGLGTEEYSREKRYEFFSSIKCDKIATAHSLSDSVETVLFRLARGTSLNGLSGIPAVRGKIVRPLIELTAEEIIVACDTLNIPYVTDESNFENCYARNKIRNEVIPVLKSINPSAEKAVARFINSAREDEMFIRKEAEKYLGEKIEVQSFRELDISVKKRVIELYASKFDVALDEKHLDSVIELADKLGKTQIKGNLFAFANKQYIYFDFINESDIQFILNSEITDSLENKKDFTFVCDCDKIIGNVFVRTREEWDSISISGRNVTKSLKKLYNELMIPVSKRASVPVICDDKGVIGVYGYAVDKRVQIDNETSRYYLLNVKSEDSN